MRPLPLLLLALAWVALIGDLQPYTLLAGLGVGAGVYAFVGPALRETRPTDRPQPPLSAGVLLRAPLFLVLYAVDVGRSGLRVARAVLRPRLAIRPGVVEIPLRARTDLEVTLLANLVSLTPGSLSLDVGRDGERRTLFVHVLDLGTEGPSAVRDEVRALERRVLTLLRGADPETA